MPKQPHPKVKILYFTEKIMELILAPCLEQETEEQKIITPNPLKQGLKLKCDKFSFFPVLNYYPKSTKTRIETSSDTSKQRDSKYYYPKSTKTRIETLEKNL